MEELFKLGISKNGVRDMLELNPNIKEISNEEVKEKIELLKTINCSEKEIMNIISSNSLYLDKTKTECLKLFKYLIDLGFDTLNILFDSNPYILNLEPFEIENYINNKKEEGQSLEDIIDELDSEPYLFNEM